MKIGFNLLLWTGHVEDEHLPLLEKLKDAGYDGVEVPLFEGDVSHYQKLGEKLSSLGLASTAVTIIPDEERNPLSADPSHREGAVEHLKWAIDCAQALNASHICGPFYQPLGVFTGEGATDDEKSRCAQVHHAAGEHAQQAGVTLAVEYLNRFECYFLNTMADVAAHVKRVDHPNVQAMYDTFHANIEEKDPIGCIEANLSCIQHVHISENDRGTPGKGHIDFATTLKKLKSLGYDGWLTIEAFGRALPSLAAATRVWRDFFPSPDEVYLEGIKMIKELWA